MDFAGYKPGSAFAPTSDWALSAGLTGPADAHHVLDPADDPAVPNLTWTYHGATISGGSDVQVTLFGFGAVSTASDPEEGLLYSFMHRDSDGKFVVDGTPAPVPVPGDGGNPGGPHDTPGPATPALLALGVPALGAAWLGRRRKGAG